MKIIFQLLVLILFINHSVSAQNNNSGQTNQSVNSILLESLKSEYGQEWNFHIDDKTGYIRGLIKKRPENQNQQYVPMVLTEEKAKKVAEFHIKNNNRIFKLSKDDIVDFHNIKKFNYPEEISGYANESRRVTFSPTRYNWIIDYRQKYKDVDVYGGGIRVVMTQDGEIYNLKNMIMPDINSITIPKISMDDAIKIAVKHMNHMHGSNITDTEITSIYNSTKLNVLPNNGDDYLAWIVDFGYPHGMRVFIDAINGNIISCFSTKITTKFAVTGNTYGSQYDHLGNNEYQYYLPGIRLEVWDDSLIDRYLNGDHSGTVGHYYIGVDDPFLLSPVTLDIYASLNGNHVKINDGGAWPIPNYPIIKIDSTVKDKETIHRDIAFNGGNPDSHGDRNSHVFRELNYGWSYYNNVFGHDQPEVTANTFTGFPSAFPDNHIQFDVVDTGHDRHKMDDTILHEYTHVVHYNINGGGWANKNCPCTTDNIGMPMMCMGDYNNNSHIDPGEDCMNHGGNANRCSCDAITEGFAEFMPANIFNDQWYRWDIDLDADIPLGEKDEIAVAGALWDIRKAEDWSGEYHIWAAMINYGPSTARELFDALIADGVSRSTALVAFYNHGIDYNIPPDTPTSLGQYMGLTEIPVGGVIGNNTGNILEIKGIVSDPDGTDMNRLQVEIRNINNNNNNFFNVPNCFSEPTNSGNIAIAYCNIESKYYHWQARVDDSLGGYSNWVSFGENPETSFDIGIRSIPYIISGPTGPTIGFTNSVYNYSILANDHYWDVVKFLIDWDDDTSTSTDYCPTGEVGNQPGCTINVSHSWRSPGTYTIRARAIDRFGISSHEENLTVDISSSGKHLWQREIIDSGVNAANYMSIALDKKGTPHIAYLKNNELKYANKTGNNWIIGSVFSGANGSSLALDPSGKPHISFVEEISGYLYYAIYEFGCMETYCGYGWWIYKVPSPVNVRGSTSIAIDSNYKAHIIYYDNNFGALKYAKMVNLTPYPTWNFETINSSINSPLPGELYYPSLAIDSFDIPHVSYHDGIKLKYAKRIGGKPAWITQIVDPRISTGQYSSIAIDSSEYPYISYYDSASYDLKYASWNGISWSYGGSVDFRGDVGKYNSLAIDSNDVPHISYNDASNMDIKYAKTGWSICYNDVLHIYYRCIRWLNETVDAQHVGGATSIALDPFDVPHIIYFNSGNSYLKYATLINIPPVVDNVKLKSSSGTNTTYEDLILTWKTFDEDGNRFKNITNWFRNGTSISVINMPFEGGSNSTFTKDYSRYNGAWNNGTVNGATWNFSGGFDGFGSYEFDGVNDYIQSERNMTISSNSRRTITFWAKPYDTSISGLVGWGKDGISQHFEAGIRNNHWFLWGYGAGKDWDTGVTPQINIWSHHAITYNGTVARWFVNGQELGSGIPIIYNTASTPLYIGINNNQGIINYFNGMIDDLRVYNYAVSPEQIYSLYKNRSDLIVSSETSEGDIWRSSITPNDRKEDGETKFSNNLTINSKPIVRNLILGSSAGTNTTNEELMLSWSSSDPNADRIKNITNWYINEKSITILNMPFEGGSNSTFTTDNSGNGNHGTVSGPNWDNVGGHDNFGVYNFDGVNDYIYIPNSSSLNLRKNTLSISLWVKLNRLPLTIPENFAGIYDSAEDSYIIYEDKTANELRFKVTDSDGTAERPGIPGSNLTTLTWHHVVGVYDGKNSKAYIYLDGKLKDVHTSPGLTGNVKSGQDAFIGKGDTSMYYFSGAVDDVMIYDRALSEEQISALYQRRNDLIVSRETQEGDIWQASITPNDGREDGKLLKSNTLKIMTSVISGNGGKVYLDTDGTSHIEDLASVNVEEIPEQPPMGADLIFGIFRFNISNVPTGSPVTLTFLFPYELPAGTTYWKFGKNSTLSIPHWYRIPSIINGKEMKIIIYDGGEGDDDLSANGRIKDDGGPLLFIDKPPFIGNPSASHEIPDDSDNIPLWGEIAQLNVTVTSDKDIESVMINISSIGGPAYKNMTNIDANIYSISANASAGTKPGIYKLKLKATDITGLSSVSEIMLEVVKNGDTNGNGAVNIGDALLCANNVTFPENTTYPLKSIYVSDVTGDGSINIEDCRRIANNVSLLGDTAFILK